MKPTELPPIVRSVKVAWDQMTAFQRFTADFGKWWPSRTHSIGQRAVKRVVFEPRVGGLIYEELIDGRRFQWGVVLSMDAPNSVRFTWHPSREPSTAQEVEVRFEREKNGTKVVLTSSHWERWGDNAGKARKGYDIGWGYILDFWAGKKSPKMFAVQFMTAVIQVTHKLSGRRARSISAARGEIEPRSAH